MQQITISIPTITYRQYVIFLVVLAAFFVGLLVGQYIAVTEKKPDIEKQVRMWAADYPKPLCDKWSWCYRNAAENWSTDQKLREDVRLESVKILTDSERQKLEPLDEKIKSAISVQKTELKETYRSIGEGLNFSNWKPPPVLEPVVPPKIENKPFPVPIRRRFFRRQ